MFTKVCWISLNETLNDLANVSKMSAVMLGVVVMLSDLDSSTSSVIL